MPTETAPAKSAAPQHSLSPTALFANLSEARLQAVGQLDRGVPPVRRLGDFHRIFFALYFVFFRDAPLDIRNSVIAGQLP
jgi:hypothetical protein